MSLLDGERVTRGVTRSATVVIPAKPVDYLVMRDNTKRQKILKRTPSGDYRLYMVLEPGNDAKRVVDVLNKELPCEW